MSRIQAAVSRGVDEWTVNRRMAEEVGRTLVAVRCSIDIRLVVNLRGTRTDSDVGD